MDSVEPIYLTSLPTADDVALAHLGQWWTLCRYTDDAVLVRGTGVDAMLPPSCMALDTVEAAIDAAVLAQDRYRLIAMLTRAVSCGVVLSSPIYPRRPEQPTHATVGAHPDGTGYAVITDPGGIVLCGTLDDPHIAPGVGLYHVTEPDRSPFAAVQAWLALVGCAGAAVAYTRAQAEQ